MKQVVTRAGGRVVAGMTGSITKMHLAHLVSSRGIVNCRVLVKGAQDTHPTPADDGVPRLAPPAAPPAPLPAASVDAISAVDIRPSDAEREMEERRSVRASEKATYQASAIAATSCMAFLTIMATYTRFAWHHDDLPWPELYATMALVVGGTFGMEMWARWAHQALWHDYEPGWSLHKSHHEPRIGAFEANDLYAVINAVPAISLCAYGFLTPGMVGGMCFGSGLGISLFGISYMFVHDGLVHRRFPVGPLAEVPYMKRVAVAHQLHHSEKYGGAPWGLFLGPQELERIPGATAELDRMVESLDWTKR